MADCPVNKNALDKLEASSQKLLDIINTTLIDTSGTTSTSFDCSDWANVKNDLINTTDGALVLFQQGINLILNPVTPIQGCSLKYAYAAQLERLSCILSLLINRVESVYCNINCPEIMGKFLCLLVRTLTELLDLSIKLTTLTNYQCCTDLISSTFFNCLVCYFVDDITELENLIRELNDIISDFVNCNMDSCSPCYVAKYSNCEKYKCDKK